MEDDLFGRYRVIDTDTHITEPADVWTSRVASKWGDRIPHIERLGDKDVWMVGSQPVGAPGAYSMAGFDGTIPDFPDTYDDIPARAAYDAQARLEHMDRERIHAQVLYPNVAGFGSAGFLKLGEPELMLDCVRAYNDFLVDWASADPDRLIPVMATPFWDVGAAVAELQRCAGLGHRSVLMCSRPGAFDLPMLGERHWDPLWAAAEEAGMPISFHVGAGDVSDVLDDKAGIGLRTHFARSSALYFLENAQTIADLTFGGICHRFPKLSFVSVESGASWLPFVLEAFDWQWKNGAVGAEHPDYDLLPSEYFKRQIYGCFWFESATLAQTLELYPDNVMFETDFPHPTSMAPGPASSAVHPAEYAASALAGVLEETVEKVLHGTAARLYRLEA
jgi:predicted TIM-barrel fold metal-dependent hydrolase